MCNNIIEDQTINYSILQMLVTEPDNPSGNNSISVLSFEKYERKILEILKTNTTNIPIIFDRIISECGVADCHCGVTAVTIGILHRSDCHCGVTDKVLIRALVTAVCFSCLDSEVFISIKSIFFSIINYLF